MEVGQHGRVKAFSDSVNEKIQGNKGETIF
jgi:hypothetical protein